MTQGLYTGRAACGCCAGQLVCASWPHSLGSKQPHKHARHGAVLVYLFSGRVVTMLWWAVRFVVVCCLRTFAWCGMQLGGPCAGAWRSILLGSGMCTGAADGAHLGSVRCSFALRMSFCQCEGAPGTRQSPSTCAGRTVHGLTHVLACWRRSLFRCEAHKACSAGCCTMCARPQPAVLLSLVSLSTSNAVLGVFVSRVV